MSPTGGTAEGITVSRRQLIQRMSAIPVLVLSMAVFGGCTDLQLPGTPRPRGPRRIGFLSSNSSLDSFNVQVLQQEFRDLGYIENRDMVMDFRFAENVPERLPALATQLISLPVDVLLAEATPAARAAKVATSSIPVVFVLVNDPVGQGLVASLAHPGANVTGVSTLSGAISGKRLELLKESVPGLARVAVVWNAANPGMQLALSDTQSAAQSLGLQLHSFGVHGPVEVDQALTDIAGELPDALLVLPNMSASSVVRGVQQIIEFAIAHRIPQMYSDSAFTEAGGTMSFGPDYASLYRRAADLVDKILSGARPSDVPVEQPTTFDLVVNVKTAQTMAMTIPEPVLLQATRVIN